MEYKHFRRPRSTASTLALAITLAIPAAVQAIPITALTAGNTLITFDSADPAGTASGELPITGLAAAETAEGIDYRPATGQLFLLGSTSRIYTVDPATGAATAVGAGPFTPALSGADFGFDFNPQADRIRVVSESDQNLRLNPDDGTVTADTALAFIAGDGSTGSPDIVASAYTDNFAGTTSTTLFGIDFDRDVLVLQEPPNDGTLSTLSTGSGLGVSQVENPAGVVGSAFDIAQTGEAFAILTTDPDGAGAEPLAARLHMIDLTTGVATEIGTVGTGLVAINGMAIVPASVLQFDAATYSVTEDGTAATVNVTRTGGSAGEVMVNVVPSDGTAVGTSDFTATPVPVTFADGDTTTQTVMIPITDDAEDEQPDETVNLAFDVPTGGAIIGPIATAVLTILGNDGPAATGTVQLDPGSYSVDEAAGTVTVTVTRIGGSAGAASVDLATSDQTALAGSDYTATTATVNFADGNADPQSVTIAITDDTTDEADETFNVTLSNAIGAALGAAATAPVTITDNDDVPGGGGDDDDDDGGCVLNANGAPDPTLPLLFLAAAFYLARRRFGLKS